MPMRISLTALIAGIVISLIFPVHVAIAGMLKEDLSLLGYDEHGFHALWVPGGCFSGVLQHNGVLLQEHTIEPVVFESLHLVLKKKSRIFRFAIQPKVLIKPFILVEELRNVLDAYQVHRHSLIFSSQPTQVQPSKTAKTSGTISKNSSKRTFWLNPYRNRLYGLHLEIRW